MAEQFVGVVSVSPQAGGPAVIQLNPSTGDITVGTVGRDGDLTLRDTAGANRIFISADHGIIVRNSAGRDVFELTSQFGLLDLGGQGSEGDLRVRNGDGEVSIHLDGNSGDIKLMGADLAEEFSSQSEIEPGSVVIAVDSANVDVARSACDKRVIGVVSGEGKLRPALRLGVQPDVPGVAVALAGRVLCKVDASFGSISVGDFLTSSTNAGHAMRVNDQSEAWGAVVGKALAPLAVGAGMVPILLALH